MPCSFFCFYLCQTMRILLTYITACALACLTFYSGAGINIISYCCTDCQSEGIEALLDNKCCDIHSHAHTHDTEKETSGEGCTDHSQDNSCSLKRIYFEWDLQNTSNLQAAFSPKVSNLPSEALLHNHSEVSTQTEDKTIKEAPPLIICSPDYLHIIDRLLI